MQAAAAAGGSGGGVMERDGGDGRGDETAGLAALLFGDDEDDGGDDGFYTQAVAVPLDNDNDTTPPTTVLHLTLAADDGAAPASLFAFSIWNGARLLAAHLQQHPALVEGKTTIEFGAAGALPSCAALALGARFSLLTDFPAPPLLHAMARTLADPRNAQALGFGVGIGPDPEGGRRRRAAVMSHLWGADATPLLAALPLPPQKAVEAGYDLALVGECLWLHREHANLLASIYRCLRPGGQALVSFSHHVPGCEALDLRFFELAQARRVYDNETEGWFEVAKRGERPMPHAHAHGRTAMQALYCLTKRIQRIVEQQEEREESA